MKKRNLVPFLLVLISTIPIGLALLPTGFFKTHDGTYHVVRLMHFYEELSRGQFPVRMAVDMANGFGSPVFNYFYPLIYYLGSLLHFLGFTYGGSLKMIIYLATLGSGISVYWWLRGYFSRVSSVVGAVVYLYAPYRLVTLYVTGQYGAELAFFFAPLLLAGVDRYLLKKSSLGRVVIVLSTFGLITSHNISVVIFAIPFTLYIGLRLIGTKDLRGKLLPFGMSFLLGIGLSAFFLVPAVLELPLIHIGLKEVYDFRQHWPTFRQLIYSPWDYWYSPKGMSLQIGGVQWLVMIVSAVCLVARLLWRNLRKGDYFAFLFLGIFWITIFLMQPQSESIWTFIPSFNHIQFPWRFLAVIVFACAFLASWVVSLARNRTIKLVLVVVILAVAFYSNRNYMRTFEPIRYSDAYYVQDRALYYGTTDVVGESLPIWVDKAPYACRGDISLCLNQQMTNFRVKGDVTSFEATTKISQLLVVNRFYFPSWQVLVDGRRSETLPIGSGGLLGFAVGPGKHSVEVRLGSSPTERVGNSLSLVSLVLLLGMVIGVICEQPLPKSIKHV